MNDSTSTSETLAIEGFTPYAQVPRWILRSGGRLSHGAVRLYGTIMTYADNDTHAAFPGRERLAQDMGVKVRSVSTYIRELEDFGALKVTRRRNRRTGNFYANHYVLVFNSPGAEYCTPPDAVDCPVTIPTTYLHPQPSTGVAREDPVTPNKSGKLPRPAKGPTPGNLSTGQRKKLRQALQQIGLLLQSGLKFHDDEPQDAWANFCGLMEDAFPSTYADHYADMLDNGKWTVSKEVANPYAAGRELNTIICTGQKN